MAVAATRFVALALEGHDLDPLRWLLGIEVALLTAFGCAGIALSPLGSPDGIVAVFVGMLGVIAMGFQNAVGRLSLSHLAATTVMTVNVTQTVLDLTDVLRGDAGIDGQARHRIRRMLPAVLAFGIGAFAGAFGVAAWSFWCLAIPIVALLGLMVA